MTDEEFIELTETIRTAEQSGSGEKYLAPKMFEYLVSLAHKQAPADGTHWRRVLFSKLPTDPEV